MILVTGGTGLVGSHLLAELTNSQTSVRAIYRSKEKILKVKELFDFYNLPSSHFDKIEWVKGDILDVISLYDAMRNIEQVYHCAALVSYVPGDFQQLIKINREGTTNVVNCALDSKVKKFGFISSTAAIGGIENELVTEETKWKSSTKASGYAISKYGAEREVWRGKEEGLDVVIVNPSIIIGPWSWDESSMKIFRTVNNGLKFYTPGTNAFVDVRDIVSIITQLMESSDTGQRYLCISENMSFKDYTSEIARQLDKKAPSISTPSWLMGLTWRVAKIYSWLSRSKPTITRETARSSFQLMTYSNSKVKAKLNYEFIPVKEAIANAVKGAHL